MPTIYREKGFRFFVYPNDHLPAHVHVKKDGAEIKVDISGKEPFAIAVYGMSDKAVNQALDIAEAKIATFRQEWEKYHGSIN